MDSGPNSVQWGVIQALLLCGPRFPYLQCERALEYLVLKDHPPVPGLPSMSYPGRTWPRAPEALELEY